MPSRDHYKKYVLTGATVCKYHSYCTSITMACEGLDADSVNVIRWQGSEPKKAKKKWQRQYCLKCGKACPHFEELERKYNK